MKSILHRPLLVAACSLLVINSVMAQAAKVEFTNQLQFEPLQSPQMENNKKTFKPKEWLEIEAQIKVQLAPEPKSKTCDALSIKWYVALKNPDKPGSMLIATKEVQHVNIPTNEEIVCSVYLSPASLRKLNGGDGGGKNAVESVGCEVFVNGEKKVEHSSKGKAGWWNSTSDKLSITTAIPLLSKPETPFASLWWDRYAEVKAAAN